jgi:hypothetical protein
MTLKRVELTDEIQRRVRAVEDALAVHVPGRESSDVIDIPKLQLADALLEAIAAQSEARLSKLPKRAAAVAPVVEISMQPKRRRRA